MKMKKSFTLIELLIVLVIIGVLATLAVSQYQNIVERSKWVGLVQTAGSLKRAAIAYHYETGKWPYELFGEGVTDAYVFEQLGIKDPNPPLPYQPNQIRLTFNGGGVEGTNHLLVCIFKDQDGDGTTGNPNGIGGYDPHIWVCEIGDISSRSGAPKF